MGSKPISSIALWFLPLLLLEFRPCLLSGIDWDQPDKTFLLQVAAGHGVYRSSGKQTKTQWKKGQAVIQWLMLGSLCC